MTKDKEKYTLKELTSLLTDKNKKFCHRWIVDFNNVKSYMFAYPDCKYKSASASADKLLENTRIKQYIDFIKDDIAKEAGISKLKIINKLTRIAFFNITDIFDVVDGNVVLAGSTKKLSDLPSDVTDIISELHPTKDGIKIKLPCQNNALINLLKAMGWNEPDKVDLTTLGNPITQVFKIGDQEIEF